MTYDGNGRRIGLNTSGSVADSTSNNIYAKAGYNSAPTASSACRCPTPVSRSRARATTTSSMATAPRAPPTRQSAPAFRHAVRDQRLQAGHRLLPQRRPVGRHAVAGRLLRRPAHALPGRGRRRPAGPAHQAPGHAGGPVRGAHAQVRPAQRLFPRRRVRHQGPGAARRHRPDARHGRPVAGADRPAVGAADELQQRRTLAAGLVRHRPGHRLRRLPPREMESWKSPTTRPPTTATVWT